MHNQHESNHTQLIHFYQLPIQFPKQKMLYCVHPIIPGFTIQSKNS